MKNWFDNLSLNKQRLVSAVLLILGLVILVIAFDNLVLLLVSIPLFIIGLVLLFYIEKKEKKNKKDKDIKGKSNSYDFALDKQVDFFNADKKIYIEKFVIPNGKEVYDNRIVETRVRGVYYNDIFDYEIKKNDEVAIKHTPNSEYPESTEVILISEGIVLGHLMKEMAIEFVAKYGKDFCFLGKIIDYEKDENDDDGKIGKIIIQFNVPKFKKATEQ